MEFEAKVDRRLVGLAANADHGSVNLAGKVDQRFAPIDEWWMALERRLGELDTKIEGVHGSLVRRTFVFGFTMTASLAGLMLSLFHQLR